MFTDLNEPTIENDDDIVETEVADIVLEPNYN